MKKNFLKNDTMNESYLQKIYNYPIYPRVAKISSDKRFVNRRWKNGWESLDSFLR